MFEGVFMRGIFKVVSGVMEYFCGLISFSPSVKISAALYVTLVMLSTG